MSQNRSKIQRYIIVDKHTQKIRFAVIGVINTGLDFGLLFLLSHLGLSVIFANYISTGTAFIFSFFANRSYTFKAHGGKLHRQLALFFIVTLFGLWVLQPIVLWAVSGLFTNSSLSDVVVLFIGKLLASVVTLTWNYIFYSRLVFKDATPKEPVE